MNYIYFNAKDWTLNKECGSIGERSFIQNFNNELTEVFQLGDWSYERHYSEINSPVWMLAAQTPYTFVFWLNGGENDRNDEICRLEVITDADEDKKSLYKLNRNFINPVLKYRGWELYAISFVTPNNGEAEVPVQLRFAAVHAPMAVMPAKDLEEYLNWTQEPDPFEQYRPQRHNMVFSEGWPADAWYSTQTLEDVHPEVTYKKKEKKSPFDKEQLKGFAADFGKEFNLFVTEFTNGAKSFAGSVKKTAKEMKENGYQETVTRKTKQAAEKVKFYGSAVGEQVEEMVSEMTSAENQEKMQEVLKKAEDAIAAAVAKGDQVGSEVLKKVKTSLQNYRNAKKQADEEMQEELAEIISEEIDDLEEALDEVEDLISDVEDEIADREDEADALDEEVDDLNEEMKDATDEEKKGILNEIKDKLSQKGEIMAALEESKNIVLKELQARRDDLAKMLHDLKSGKAEDQPEETAKEDGAVSIEIEGEDE